MANITPLIKQFFKDCPHVSLSIRYERLNGVWDALMQNRSHLAIGTTGDPPEKLDYGIDPLGQMQMEFVCSPDHPLSEYEFVTSKDIEGHFGAIVTDTSKGLPKRTSGVYKNQKHITVNSMQAKRELILSGAAVGYLHTTLIQKDIDKGRLLALNVDALKKKATYSYAWRKTHEGKALEWWLDKLKSPKTKAELLS